MTVLAQLVAFAFLSVFVGTIVGAALTEKPLATCARCRRGFDSLPAFNAHAIEGCDQ